MSSSSYHGVTTALIGNCGVTFAPVTKKNHRYLAELMEAVEDIAADAIMDGLPWNWESYGEYLDCIESLNPALNVVGLVGHSAVRLEAMGDKSMDEGVQPDDKELEHITQMVKQSLEEGAVGFSTSRFLQHTVPDGRLYSRNLGRPERNSGHTKSCHRRRRYWRSISISQRHGDSL